MALNTANPPFQFTSESNLLIKEGIEEGEELKILLAGEKLRLAEDGEFEKEEGTRGGVAEKEVLKADDEDPIRTSRSRSLQNFILRCFKA